GEHQHAGFTVSESDEYFDVALRSDDGRTRVEVSGRVVPSLPSGSVFPNLAEASAFFRRGSVGYSATSRPGQYDGLGVRNAEWHADALAVNHVASSFFEDASRFPVGSTVFDCALVMRGVYHSWHALPVLSHSTFDAPAA